MKTNTTILYKQYRDSKAIGCFPLCNFGGLEILDIEYGINDKLITCFNFGTGRYMISRNTVHTAASGREYIRKAGTRYYLDQMLRV